MLDAAATVQVDLQQVLLHLFVLQQISERTPEQLHTHRWNVKRTHNALTQNAPLTMVFPAPLGPTSSTELLSPWTAVRRSSSSRCLRHKNYITHKPLHLDSMCKEMKGQGATMVLKVRLSHLC